MAEGGAVVLVFLILGAVAVTYIVARFGARRLHSQEIIKAIEMGQELPMAPRRRGSFFFELRSGILLIAFGIGLAIVMGFVDNGDGFIAGVIPFLLGIGFLVNAFLVRRYDAAADAAAEAAAAQDSSRSQSPPSSASGLPSATGYDPGSEGD